MDNDIQEDADEEGDSSNSQKSQSRGRPRVQE